MTGVTPSLRALLGRLTAHRVRGWDESYGITEVPEEEGTQDLLTADVISSKYRDGSGHALLLDMDIPVTYVPSTTSGHGHLYIEPVKPISDTGLNEILDVLAKWGIIEEGYAGASKRRGYTSLRLPWVQKGRPILRCVRCDKRPDEISEYVTYALEQTLRPDDFVWENEGSLNRNTGQFACTDCYIKLGQPTGTADTYVIHDPF